MEKLKQFCKNNIYTFVTGGIAIFIILLVYFCFDIIPFGDRTVYRMDLYHQYGPLFSELYDRLTGGESLIYSWNSGLGMSFLGNFYNYLSSPISLIVLIFGHKNTFEAVATIIAIKAVLSSMSMANYLKKSQKLNSPLICAFGILYAFSAYFIAYYWNVMWIDAMYILPFVVLGIERIIDEGKSGLYLVSLVYCIFSNYYIGFMVCIFSCLYFIYYYVCRFDVLKAKSDELNSEYFIDKIKNLFIVNSAVKFAAASLCAGLVLLFMLIPVLFVLGSSSATKGTFPTEFKFYFNIFDFLANHIASLEPTIRSSGETVLPNIYCGILTVMLLPIYILSNKIPSKEKIASAVLLIIMFFSFNINYLNYIWHGFHFPNDLPYRQSFMYSFILVVLAFKAIKHIEFTDRKTIIASGGGLALFVVLVQEITSKNANDTSIYLTLAFILLYTVILGLLQSKKNQAFALSVMVACSVTAEAVSASTDHYVANQTKSSFSIDYDDFKNIQSTVHSKNKNLFFREETTKSRARMDPCWFGYNGVSVFSSMAYEKVADMQKSLGMYGNKINSYTYNPQTPVYNSLFSLKYIYDKNNYIGENSFYNKVAENNTFSAYENPYFLNIAFPVSQSVKDFDASEGKNPVAVQEQLFEAATGINGLFNRIYDYEILYSNLMTVADFEKETESFRLSKLESGSKAAATILFPSPVGGNVYIYVSSRNVENVVVYSPVIQNTMTVSDGYILDLGKHKIGEEISVEIPVKENVSYAQLEFCAFTIDEEKFTQGYEKLKEGQIEYERFDETYIKGKYTAEENEILFTSIPYDKSWNVYVDGKKVSSDDIIKVSDALLGIKTESGTHEIVFKYDIPCYNLCIFISAGFTVLLLLLYVLKSRKWLFFKNCNNIWQRTKSDENEQPIDIYPDDLIDIEELKAIIEYDGTGEFQYDKDGSNQDNENDSSQTE